MSMVPWFPVTDAEGNWFLPEWPSWRFPSDEPLQGPRPAVNASCRSYGRGTGFTGKVEAHHITNIPTVIPNVGIPLTDLNVSTLLLEGGLGHGGLPDVFAELYRSNGFEVLAICVWEFRDSRIGPDLLGYEVEVITVSTGPVPATASPLLLLTAIGILIIVLPLFLALDALTGGQIGLVDAFTGAVEDVIESIGGAVEGVVGAPFQGAAFLLLGGVGVIVALGYFLGETGIDTSRPTAVFTGAAKTAAAVVAAPTPAARSVQAVTSAARGRAPSGGGRGGGRRSGRS